MYGGIFTVLEELKVENIIIGKQFENSDNYEKFTKILKNKKIKIYILENNNTLNIEKNMEINVLWPEKTQAISKNSINNNALVLKLKYKDFTMLFTGDIEKEAEEILIKKYEKTTKLKSSILKVGHHGSKTSTSEEFLNLIKPQIALIGVGKKNNFGHPSNEVIERLNNLRCENI